MTHSPDAQGATVSHEAIYRWIYALPKGELAKSAIMLRSKRTRRKRRAVLGERTRGRIIGMVSIDDRPETASDRGDRGERVLIHRLLPQPSLSESSAVLIRVS